MAVSTDLFSAILAMDTYNRGYEAGISGLSDAVGTKIGNASIIASDGDEAAQLAGFFAIAYSWNGRTVISFRGTETNTILDLATDIFNGWVTGAGILFTESTLAEEFYDSVTNSTLFSGGKSDVLLTGHSLGGGLAGYIAAVSGDKANIFDSMPYAAAALNRVILEDIARGVTDFTAFFTGGDTSAPVPLPNASGIESISTDGEILSYVRPIAPVAEVATVTAFLSPIVGPVSAALLGVAAAAEAIDIGTEEASSTFDSFGTTVSSIQLHSPALLVLLQYASDHDLTDWRNIGSELTTAYFDVGVAAPLRLSPSQMLSEIAYSAIDSGAMPFGDTGIRALFHDADSLGQIYATGSLPRALSAAGVESDLAAITVEYAGNLATNKDTSAAHAAGVIDYDADTSSVEVNLTDRVWTINGVLPDTIFDQGDLLANLLQGLPHVPSVNGVDDLVLATGDSGATLDADGTLSATDRALLVAGAGDDTMNGSPGNDIFITGAGDDVVNGGTGSDIAYFSDPASDYQLVHDADGAWTVDDVGGGGTGDSSILTGVEYAEFGDGEDFILGSNGSLDQTNGAAGAINPGGAIGSPSIGVLILRGHTELTRGGKLDFDEAKSKLENDGTIRVSASRLDIDTLSGDGGIVATNNSILKIGSDTSGERIELQSAHLYIGDGASHNDAGLHFLAPITNFGLNSLITLYNTAATKEIFAKSTPMAGELLLYDRSRLVADLHISGQAKIFAAYDPSSGPGGAVTLSAIDGGHSLPSLDR